jgi:hypothetical protein
MPASHSKRFGASNRWKCNRNEQRTTALDIYQDWSLEYTYQCVCMCVHTQTRRMSKAHDVKLPVTSLQCAMCLEFVYMTLPSLTPSLTIV